MKPPKQAFDWQNIPIVTALAVLVIATGALLVMS